MFNLFGPSYGLALNPADLRPLSKEELRERDNRFWLEMRPASPEQIAEYARMCQNWPTESTP